jgi:nicotinamidase-related amidase
VFEDSEGKHEFVLTDQMFGNRRRSLDHWGRDVREFLENRGFGRSVAPGTRPAIVVVDLSKAFTDPESPVGGNLDGVVAGTATILAAARTKAIPIFFTTQAFMPDMSDAGVMYLKQPALELLKLGTEAVEIDPRIAPLSDEPLIVKKAASAFFGTPLSSLLVQRDVDTLILTGCSTSGCIRATATDAYSYNYRILVPHDCVGDRTPQAHEANLFDIQVKMGEVVSSREVLTYLKGIPQPRSPLR